MKRLNGMIELSQTRLLISYGRIMGWGRGKTVLRGRRGKEIVRKTQGLEHRWEHWVQVKEDIQSSQ